MRSFFSVAILFLGLSCFSANMPDFDETPVYKKQIEAADLEIEVYFEDKLQSIYKLSKQYFENLECFSKIFFKKMFIFDEFKDVNESNGKHALISFGSYKKLPKYVTKIKCEAHPKAFKNIVNCIFLGDLGKVDPLVFCHIIDIADKYDIKPMQMMILKMISCSSDNATENNIIELIGNLNYRARFFTDSYDSIWKGGERVLSKNLDSWESVDKG